jgi:hypothetical protein
MLGFLSSKLFSSNRNASLLVAFYFYFWPITIGVSDVQTDVQAKSVVVISNEHVSKDEMLQKLEKVTC